MASLVYERENCVAAVDVVSFKRGVWLNFNLLKNTININERNKVKKKVKKLDR